MITEADFLAGDPALNTNYSSYSLKREYIIVHHSGAEEKNAEQIRQYHLSKGWRGIGYNYVVERDGKVVRGRSLALPGAHCSAGQMNFKGIGVCVIGNLENHSPLPAQVESLKFLLAELRQTHGIPVDHQLGHGQVPGAATDCPGKHFPCDLLRENPVRLVINGKERNVNLRIVNEHTEIQIDGHWVKLVSILAALGASWKWVGQSRTIEVYFW